jgi:glycosyltransferase involved in cell wall biosynthesis
MRLVWVVPEESGGILTYSNGLWPSIERACVEAGWEAVRVDSAPVRTRAAARELAGRIRELKPSLIHVQHEFGLFGSKRPLEYQFPYFLKSLHGIAPAVATAHTVLGAEYVLPLKGEGLGLAVRRALNHFALPYLRRLWLEKSWGALDGVVVHSRLQVASVGGAGCGRVVEIPHFVFDSRTLTRGAPRDVVVFGYFSPEKGQDVAISAWKLVPGPGRLVLAGGVRRPEDQDYFDRCKRLISELGLEARVEITGFVPEKEIDSIYARAALVVAPFRETSGSGSLAQAFARGMPILASDLPLNQELNDRVLGCVATFRSEAPEDCARQIQRLLEDGAARDAMAVSARRYADLCSPKEIAALHMRFYEELGRTNIMR